MKTLSPLYSKTVFALVSLFLISVGGVSGQLSNYIYGINNPTNGVYYFSKADLTTGSLTDLSLIPSWSSVVNENACVDNINFIYYLSSGTSLTGFDPLTGNIVSNVTLPISSTANFIYSAFNMCDTSIYGIINDPPSSISFASYKPSTGIMTIISALDPNSSFCPGCMSFIDPANQVFVIQSTTLKGLGLADGEIKYDHPIVDLPNEVFGHLAYDWATQKIYGASANTNNYTKYFSIIDPLSGIVSHVAEDGWNSGFWKPVLGGDCIDQSEGTYYYSAGTLLNGIRISTGEIISSQTVSSGEGFILIQHFSSGTCNLTGVAMPLDNQNKTNIFPNPTNGILNIFIPSSQHAAAVSICNLLGEEMISSPVTNASNVLLDVSSNANGMYFVKVVSEKGTEMLPFVLQR